MVVARYIQTLFQMYIHVNIYTCTPYSFAELWQTGTYVRMPAMHTVLQCPGMLAYKPCDNYQYDGPVMLAGP